MPEMPEVETIRRQIDARLTGRRIVDAGSHPSHKFTPARDCAGATVVSLGRRGKFLLVSLDHPDRMKPAELIVHLGMTGVLSIEPSPPAENPHRRAWWNLDDGSTLAFDDVRRFGRIRLVDAGDYRSIPTLATAGPEPFDPLFDAEDFWNRLRTSSRKIKTQLLSQRPIAGVGNIYADEALWLAGINPRAKNISRTRAALLLDAIRNVLSQGIDNGGTTLRDYRNAEGGKGENQSALAAYGRGGLPCVRCGSTLRSATIDQRTTTWCPSCQRR